MPELILASASPRRAELLQQLQLQFRVQAANIDESVHSGESPSSYVRRMACEKANAIADTEASDAFVLGADTSVIVDQHILGKPKNQDHAAQMLRLLSGRCHQVMTAVALCHNGETRCLLQTTEVCMRSIDDEEINAYWASGEPIGKAGGYAIQGRAAIFIHRINGSYSSVMGLALAETAELLAPHGFQPLSAGQ